MYIYLQPEDNLATKEGELVSNFHNYNIQGYAVCGVRNQRGRPCMRIGKIVTTLCNNYVHAKMTTL